MIEGAGAKTKTARNGLSRGRGAVVLLVGLVLVALGVLWLAREAPSGREPGDPGDAPGDGQPTDPAEETLAGPRIVPSERADATIGQATRGDRGPELVLPGDGTQQDPLRFEGRGRLRGHAEVAGDEPFPPSWRLVLAPSSTLVGRERAQERVLDLAGTQEFVVEDLPLAGYDVWAEATGWNPQRQPILLERRSPEAFLNLRMVRAGTVRGRVVDHRGLPAVGVELVLTTLATREMVERRTDELGHYRFEEVLDGAYELTFGPFQNPITRERKTLRIRAPGMTLPDLELPPLATLQLVVIDGIEERVLQGVRVIGSGVQGGVLDLRTDAYGELIARHLPPGRWRLRLEFEGYRERREHLELVAGEVESVVLALGP